MIRRLPFWALIPPALLVLLYGFLIYFALTNQTGFYEAMLMPQPNHGFMHISWTGKTIAIWLVLCIALIARRADWLLLALVAVLAQQLGDSIAGARTGVDVFITNIGLGLSTASVLALGVSRHRKSSI